jgi:hypothetical protein
VAQQVLDLGGAQQRLGGDAAPIETDPSQVLALDDRFARPELARGSATQHRARPHHDHVEFGIRHALPIATGVTPDFRSLIRR